MKDSISRFSNRAENYLKYRPRYPQAILPFLQEKIGLHPEWTVADIGSGTGFLAERFLQNGNRVIGVEPNDEMRQAGARHLSGYANFESVEGSAEETGLPPASVELVAAGQSFHWFDTGSARLEFLRILRPPGWVVLIWNDRREGSSAFMRGYEQFLANLASDYRKVSAKNVLGDPVIDFFGGKDRVNEAKFDNVQHLDWEKLLGRALSSSYAPLPNHPEYGAFVERLRQLYEEHEEDGRIAFEYDTRLYYGQLHA